MAAYVRMVGCIFAQPSFMAPPANMTGKTVIVTGPTVGGIGFETAKTLASFGATVILAARNPSKAAKAADLIRSAIPDAPVKHAECDLSRLETVSSFAAELRTLAPGGVDVLVCNAGVQTSVPATNAKGVEMTFAACALGHHLVIHLVRPRRLVWVTGDAYCTAAGMPDPYVKEAGNQAYARASLARLLLAREWKRRSAESGEGMEVVAVHPGVILTNIVDLTGWARKLFQMFSITTELGAQASVYAATAPSEEIQQERSLPYYHNKHGWYTFAKGDLALDEEFGKQLFDTCNELCGI